jgi:hypothetical protein
LHTASIADHWTGSVTVLLKPVFSGGDISHQLAGEKK